MDFDYTRLLDHFLHIGTALAIGLLVGSERGWHERGWNEGTRVAGIRTFSLIALFGGIIATASIGLDTPWRWLLCGLAFLPVATLLALGFAMAAQQSGNLSITTSIAAMITFWLGTLPAFELALPAAASAVILALVLHLKDQMHSWLHRLDQSELLGTLQFLLVSVVLLPLLPNQGFGPWQFFNPYKLWWMVVIISGLSLFGYFAMRLAGSRKGIVATSLAGGLASSTAVTMSLSRLHRDLPATGGIAAGILLAASTMFARLLIVVSVLNPGLIKPLLLPLATGMITLLVSAWWLWRQKDGIEGASTPQVHNPFQLIPALQFAALLALVMFAAEALQAGFGDIGLYALSVFTGIADVDAIALSLAPKGGGALAATVVVLCIALAAATNTLMKGVYCLLIAGRQLGLRVLIPMAVSAALVTVTALVLGFDVL